MKRKLSAIFGVVAIAAIVATLVAVVPNVSGGEDPPLLVTNVQAANKL